MNEEPVAVRLGFSKEGQSVPLEMLYLNKPMPEGMQRTVKYLQIRESVRVVGLVEPLVVVPHGASSNSFLVLDGNMRLAALRELKISHARCLLSTDDEAYTYNKRVNRLSVVQAHQMIVRGAKTDSAVTKLAAALNVSETAIRGQFKLLDGICPEAISLLADKPATQGMFRVLRKVKPFRQIDIAQGMINLNNYSIRLATAMLHMTPPEQLEEKYAARVKPQTPSETLQRMERELAALQADTKLVEESYGPENLKLEIVKSHIRALLEKASVVRWLAKFHREYLQQLQIIAELKHLPSE